MNKARALVSYNIGSDDWELRLVVDVDEGRRMQAATELQFEELSRHDQAPAVTLEGFGLSGLHVLRAIVDAAWKAGIRPSPEAAPKGYGSDPKPAAPISGAERAHLDDLRAVVAHLTKPRETA